ncbi:MAG: hypothetical protein AB8G05_17745 [Oligoflexales bacterium]
MTCQADGLKSIAILARTGHTLDAIGPILEANELEYSKLDRNTSTNNEHLVTSFHPCRPY